MTDTNDSGEAGMRVDTDLVRQLAQLLHESDLSEIEVEDGDRRVAVKRQIITVPAAAAAHAPAPASPSLVSSPAPQAGAPALEDGSDHPGAVKSPMVGTVYLAGEPGATPFVGAGAKVAVGDTLLIVEAMKVMNPITAPRDGTVTKVLVQDAQPVEYDQPLLIIE